MIRFDLIELDLIALQEVDNPFIEPAQKHTIVDMKGQLPFIYSIIEKKNEIMNRMRHADGRSDGSGRRHASVIIVSGR